MQHTKAGSVPAAVRLDAELVGELKELADKMGISLQDVIRLCVETGLRDLVDSGADIPALIRAEAARVRAERKKKENKS